MNKNKPTIGITTDIKTVVNDESFVIEKTYTMAIANAGGIPIFLPTLSGNRSLLKDIVTKIDGLLLPGGRDMDPKFYNEEPHPELRPMSLERTESEMIILEEALERDMPVLGVCGGMQLINVFFGGSLFQDIPTIISNALSHERGSVHEIHVEENTLLEKIVKEKNFSIKSYHHQSVKALGRGLKVCAKCPDGVVEGIEITNSFILGLQWHPEREETEISTRIYKAFVDACKGI
jgi:putative glutamine amidotransferase